MTVQLLYPSTHQTDASASTKTTQIQKKTDITINIKITLHKDESNY